MPGLTPRRARLLLLGAAVAAGSGCVDRRFVVETNVPGAQIAVDGTPLGPSPVDSQYLFAGTYVFTASAPGYETARVPVALKAKWYQYPPFDFIVEVLYPGRIEDVRTVRITLDEARPKSEADLLGAADRVRQRGQSLPPPAVPNDAGRGPAAPRPPAIPPTAPGPNQGSAAPVNPQVPASTLPPISSPRDGDTPGGIIRPPGGG